MKYEIFDSEKSRKDLVRISNNLAKFLHYRGIENIIFLDRSARPGYLGLINAWNKLYSEEKRPNIYFTNPEGYQTRKKSEIINEFKKVYKNLPFLPEDKNKEILVFDTCVHTGNTMAPVVEVLKDMGYRNVVLGSTQPIEKVPWRESLEEIQLDFASLNHCPDMSCYPFDRDKMIKKSGDSILSTKNNYKGDIRYSKQIRKEISQIFKDLKNKK